MRQESTKPTIYSGTFERSLDAKKRVAIPSAWVSGEGEEFHVVPHPNFGQLMVMGLEELGRWEQTFQELPLSPSEKRIAIREFYGAAHAVSTDKQGRILLPEKHCEEAGLKSEVIFIGARSRFEIWSKERCEASKTKNKETFKQAADLSGL